MVYSCTISTNIDLPLQLIFSSTGLEATASERKESNWRSPNLTEFLDSLEVFRSKLPMLSYFLSECM